MSSVYGLRVGALDAVAEAAPLFGGELAEPKVVRVAFSFVRRH